MFSEALKQEFHNFVVDPESKARIKVSAAISRPNKKKFHIVVFRPTDCKLEELLANPLTAAAKLMKAGNQQGLRS